MKNILTLGIIPLLCLIVMILTALVVIFALRRGTKKINEQAQEYTSESNRNSSANSRWARGDLHGSQPLAKEEEPMLTCPACGGENVAGSSTCAFCGKKL
jgi:uncharacterized membrane protein